MPATERDEKVCTRCERDQLGNREGLKRKNDKANRH